MGLASFRRARGSDGRSLRDWATVLEHSVPYKGFCIFMFVMCLFAVCWTSYSLFVKQKTPMRDPGFIALEIIITVLFVLEVGLRVWLYGGLVDFLRIGWLNRLDLCIVLLAAIVLVVDLYLAMAPHGKEYLEEFQLLDVMVMVLRYVVILVRLYFFMRRARGTTPDALDIADRPASPTHHGYVSQTGSGDEPGSSVHPDSDSDDSLDNMAKGR